MILDSSCLRMGACNGIAGLKEGFSFQNKELMRFSSLKVSFLF